MQCLAELFRKNQKCLGPPEPEREPKGIKKGWEAKVKIEKELLLVL